MMRKTSPNVSDDEVAKIISEVDLDGDGTINFDGRAAPCGLKQSAPVHYSFRQRGITALPTIAHADLDQQSSSP